MTNLSPVELLLPEPRFFPNASVALSYLPAGTDLRLRWLVMEKTPNTSGWLEPDFALYTARIRRRDKSSPLS